MYTLFINLKIMNTTTLAANIFMEGGPFMMTLILLSLMAALFFVIKGFINVKKSPMVARKMLKLTSDASLLGLVLGFLGSILGLIGAFDAIEMMGDVSSGMMAGGLKVSFLTVLFGSFTFIIARLGILILRSLLSAEHQDDVVPR